MNNTPSHIEYDDIGEGPHPPVVFIHGMMTDRSVFAEQAKRLSKARRVLNIDLRGFGESGNKASYEMTDFVDDIRHLLETLNIQKAVLIGWSMGGAIALAVAAEYPQIISKVILVSSTPCLVQRPDWSTGIPAHDAAQLTQLLASDWAIGAVEFSAMVVNDDERQTEREFIKQVCLKSRRSANLSTIETIGKKDLRSTLFAITRPVDVICGTHDRICPKEASEYMARVTGGRVCLIEGAGHAPFLTRADEFETAAQTLIN